VKLARVLKSTLSAKLFQTLTISSQKNLAQIRQIIGIMGYQPIGLTDEWTKVKVSVWNNLPAR